LVEDSTRRSADRGKIRGAKGIVLWDLEDNFNANDYDLPAVADEIVENLLYAGVTLPDGLKSPYDQW
jgi:hypothetical protein